LVTALPLCFREKREERREKREERREKREERRD
jgi:hypothetical protein